MGIKTKMDIRGSISKKLDKAKVQLAMHKAMKESMLGLNKAIQRKTPVQTGNLRRSMNYQVANKGTVVTGEIRNSAHYWTYVNFGTSKMEARNFVDKGYKAYQPEKKIAEAFKTFYKGG